MKTFKLIELGEERLRKMIQFLKELPENKFSFASVVKEYDKINDCGTVCCAIGWTPIIFSKLVRWDPTYDVCGLLLTGNEPRHYSTVAARLFGLTEEIADVLFTPSFQDVIHKDLPICGEFSKPSGVASMLEKFIELCNQGEIKVRENEEVFEPIPDNKTAF